jgi:tetraprenyl-beta-curcumene synthase
MASTQEAATLAWAMLAHRRSVVPRVRVEQRRWASAAAAIPAPQLRAAALGALGGKGANAEATAVFALLAPRAQREPALRAMTALQTAVDYLDTLGERPLAEPLAAGLALHEALPEALAPGGRRSEWYRHYPQGEDGGYLAALVEGCRVEVAALPGGGGTLAAARRAARRCGEGQSHTHAAFEDGGARLRAWAESLALPGEAVDPAAQRPSAYRWWEVAAGACSSVAAGALIAAAADPHLGAAEAEAIDAAYFPPVGALTVLLDDLVDRERDRAEGEHSYLAYYAGVGEAAERLALLAGRARAAVAGLRQRHRHAAILAGVAAFYLSSPAARGDYAQPIRNRMLETLGGNARLALVVLSARNRGR